MRKANLFFQSDFGNIVYDCYEPEDFNGRVIQIAHGMIEHKERYLWLCEEFTKAGYKVYINDHRGHGESVGGNVFLGEMGENGFEKAVGDMLSLNEIIRRENKESKIILLGHSMGSLLSRRFLQLYEDRIDALILSGSPSPNAFASLGSKLSLFLKQISFNKKFEQLAQGFIHFLSLGSFNARFKTIIPKSSSHWICSDVEVVKKYDKDKKCQFLFSLNSFANLFAGVKQVFSKYPNAISKPNLPILFISGRDDACGDFGKGVQKAYNHICTQGYKNVTLKLYDNCRHEVFNEKDKEIYLQDVLDWLKKIKN